VYCGCTAFDRRGSVEVDGEGHRCILVSKHPKSLYNNSFLIVHPRSSPELQLQRLMKRDNSTREDASSRLKSQLPISEKVEFADHVIENSGSLQDLEVQVDSLLVKVDKEVGQVWWRLSWVIPPFGAFSALSMLMWRAIWRARKTRKRKG
jgi:hypothetical protein